MTPISQLREKLNYIRSLSRQYKGLTNHGVTQILNGFDIAIEALETIAIRANSESEHWAKAAIEQVAERLKDL